MATLKGAPTPGRPTLMPQTPGKGARDARPPLPEVGACEEAALALKGLSSLAPAHDLSERECALLIKRLQGLYDFYNKVAYPSLMLRLARGEEEAGAAPTGPAAAGVPLPLSLLDALAAAFDRYADVIAARVAHSGSRSGAAAATAAGALLGSSRLRFHCDGAAGDTDCAVGDIDSGADWSGLVVRRVRRAASIVMAADPRATEADWSLFSRPGEGVASSHHPRDFGGIYQGGRTTAASFLLRFARSCHQCSAKLGNASQSARACAFAQCCAHLADHAAHLLEAAAEAAACAAAASCGGAAAAPSSPPASVAGGTGGAGAPSTPANIRQPQGRPLPPRRPARAWRRPRRASLRERWPGRPDGRRHRRGGRGRRQQRRGVPETHLLRRTRSATASATC